MDEKLEGIANRMMEQFQNEGLSYRQVDRLISCIDQMLKEEKWKNVKEAEEKPFRAIFF